MYSADVEKSLQKKKNGYSIYQIALRHSVYTYVIYIFFSRYLAHAFQPSF